MPRKGHSKYNISKEELWEIIHRNQLANSWYQDEEYLTADVFIEDKVKPGNKFSDCYAGTILLEQVKDDGRIYSFRNWDISPPADPGDLSKHNRQLVITDKRTGKKELRLKLPMLNTSHFTYIDGELKEVFRSSWRGSLSNGYPILAKNDLDMDADLWEAAHKMAHGVGIDHKWSGYRHIEDWKQRAWIDVAYGIMKYDPSFHLKKKETPNPFSFAFTCATNAMTAEVKKYYEIENHELSGENEDGSIIDELALMSGDGYGLTDYKSQNKLAEERIEKEIAEQDAPVKVINPITDPVRFTEIQRQYDPDFELTDKWIRDWKKRHKKISASKSKIVEGKKASIDRRRQTKSGQPNPTPQEKKEKPKKVKVVVATPEPEPVPVPKFHKRIRIETRPLIILKITKIKVKIIVPRKHYTMAVSGTSHNGNARVVRVNVNGRWYDSIKEAAIAYGIGPGTMHKYCTGLSNPTYVKDIAFVIYNGKMREFYYGTDKDRCIGVKTYVEDNK